MSTKSDAFKKEVNALFVKTGELFKKASELFSLQDDCAMPDWNDYYASVEEGNNQGLFRQEVTYRINPVTAKDKRFAKKRRVRKEASL